MRDILKTIGLLFAIALLVYVFGAWIMSAIGGNVVVISINEIAELSK